MIDWLPGQNNAANHIFMLPDNLDGYRIATGYPISGWIPEPTGYLVGGYKYSCSKWIFLASQILCKPKYWHNFIFTTANFSFLHLKTVEAHQVTLWRYYIHLIKLHSNILYRYVFLPHAYLIVIKKRSHLSVIMFYQCLHACITSR